MIIRFRPQPQELQRLEVGPIGPHIRSFADLIPTLVPTARSIFVRRIKFPVTFPPRLIRKIAPEGTNWIVTTLAGRALNPGSADGMGNEARFLFPYDVGGRQRRQRFHFNAIRKGYPPPKILGAPASLPALCSLVHVAHFPINSPARMPALPGPRGNGRCSRANLF